jgi:hypothetical protein
MIYSDIYVKEPIDKIAQDWDFLSEEVIQKFHGFRPVGDNVYGVRRVTHERPDTLGQTKKGPLDLVANRRNLEIGPQGVVTVPRTPFSVHVTLAGTPHHTEFLFGYWHINDKDEIIIPLPPTETEPGYILIVMGHPKDNETDRVAWYCGSCASLLFMRELVTGTAGFQKFWPWERAAVADYNSDPRHHVCNECGHVNPAGYTAFPMRDTPEEREARLKW